MRTYILKNSKDAHGQPTQLFRAARENNEIKAISQLSGICEGILADGEVNEREARFFSEWIRQHAAIQPVWPLTDILLRIEKIFADGRYDEEERQELKEIMEALCGHSSIKAVEDNYSTSLPFDKPEPTPLIFKNHIFNITGKFAFGTRRQVIEAITTKGAIAMDVPPTRESHYLVVGIFASRDWIESNHGRKIERGIQLRDSGSGLAIISEEHLKQFLS